MANSQTIGVHHIGLSVEKLEETANFFRSYLGWSEVRRDLDYPAIFVSDGKNMVSLWGMNGASNVNGFDNKKNVGLHHLAFEVENNEALEEINEILEKAPDVEIEFSPELLRGGPARHMMCLEPSGIRVEFIWPGS